jgi:hypothetical protein
LRWFFFSSPRNNRASLVHAHLHPCASFAPSIGSPFDVPCKAPFAISCSFAVHISGSSRMALLVCARARGRPKFKKCE